MEHDEQRQGSAASAEAGDDELSDVKRRLSEVLAVIEQREAVEHEAPGMSDGDRQRRMKSFTIDLPARYRRFKLACIGADRTIAEEVLAPVERRTEEMEVATAMERFTAVARERGMMLGELLEHALDDFVREQEGRAKER
jgi:hypothetical protein